MFNWDFKPTLVGCVFAVCLASTCGASMCGADESRFVVSPEVSKSGSVTFRFQSESAKQVRLVVDGMADPIEMRTKGDGLFQATTADLPPGIHAYCFDVDGTEVIDPANTWMKKWLVCRSLVEVIETDEARSPLTQARAVPHGVTHRHLYPSKATGHDRAAVVYTPPGYDIRRERAYPILVLCHGFGDDETVWTEVGRAHLILDNLIAEDRIEPFVVVMPNGHPIPHRGEAWSENYGNRNIKRFINDLAGDLMPLVYRGYHVRRDASGRAIAGLSMGGGHAIATMMAHPEQFGHVGGFSASVPQGALATSHPDWVQKASANNQQRRLLWIACGRDDFLLDRNLAFVKRLRDVGVDHEFVTCDGGHQWPVWRNHLSEFAQLAFPKQPTSAD